MVFSLDIGNDNYIYIMIKYTKKRFSGGELSENEFETYVNAMHVMGGSVRTLKQLQ